MTLFQLPNMRMDAPLERNNFGAISVDHTQALQMSEALTQAA